MKYIKKFESINENKRNAKIFKNIGGLGPNDQFNSKVSLSKTLSDELGFDLKKEFSEGVGFDNVSMYDTASSKTIVGDALSGKHTYDDLVKLAKEWYSKNESVVNEAKKLGLGDKGVDYNDTVVEIIAMGNYNKIAKMFKKEMKNDAADYGFEDTAKGDYYLAKIISNKLRARSSSNEYNKGDFAIYPVKYDMANYWGLDPVKESVNEAVKLSLDVEEPFNINKEKAAASKFKWIPNPSPVTISKVEGEISNDKTDLTIHFTNGDKIYYKYDANTKYSMIFTGISDSYKVSETLIDNILGSTSTVVGDIALIYSIFKDGKKSSSFSKY
jgi:hypothetical protein